MLNILAWLFFWFNGNAADTGECSSAGSDKPSKNCKTLTLDCTEDLATCRQNSRKGKAIEKIEEYLMEKSWEAVNSDHASTVLLSSSNSQDDTRPLLVDEDDLVAEVAASDSQEMPLDYGDASPVSSTPMQDQHQTDLQVDHSGRLGRGPAVSLNYNDITDGNMNGRANTAPSESNEDNRTYKSSMYVRSTSPRPSERGAMHVELKARADETLESAAPESERLRSDSWEKLDASLENKDPGRTKISIHVGESPAVGKTVVLDPTERVHVHTNGVHSSPGIVKITHSVLSTNGTPTAVKRIDTFNSGGVKRN